MSNNHIIAITGPSMAGKTTLTNRLVSEFGFAIPKHITTREKRIDDAEGFYRYLSLDDFNLLKKRGELLLCSGVGDRMYGIQKEDCATCFLHSSEILINISYKDIEQYNNIDYRKILIVLTYRDILNGMLERYQSGMRTMPIEELYKRIIAAQQDHIEYFNLVQKISDGVIYTDEFDAEATFEKAKSLIKRLY